jgi:hypothetical protein
MAHLILSLCSAVITPGFHALFIEAMVRTFTRCSERTISKLEELTESEGREQNSTIVDLESEFSNLALDIIGLGVFNFDFDSVTKESPVIKVGISVVLSYVYLCIGCIMCARIEKVTESREEYS